MSPLLRDQLVIVLTPDHIKVSRRSRGWRPTIQEERTLLCSEQADAGASQWHVPLSVLREFLSTSEARAGDVTVVLSDSFIHYLLVPWTAEIVRRADQRAFAESLFIENYGDDAQRWVVQLAGARAGQSQVAAAIERSLLEELTAIFAPSHLRLGAIEPQLMNIVNSNRQALSGDAWLLVVGRDRMLVGLLREGNWLSLRSRPHTNARLSIEQLLQQECLLHGITPRNEKIHIYGADGSPLTFPPPNPNGLASTVSIEGNS